MRCALRAGNRSDIESEQFLQNCWLETAPGIAVGLVLDAMAEPDAEGAAAWAFGRWLECDRALTEAAAAATTGTLLERAQSFQALSRQPGAAVLADLAGGSEPVGVETWEREARIAAMRADTKSLSAESLGFHARLLQLVEPPSVYREFLKWYAWDLALGIDGIRPLASVGLLKLPAESGRNRWRSPCSIVLPTGRHRLRARPRHWRGASHRQQPAWRAASCRGGRTWCSTSRSSAIRFSNGHWRLSNPAACRWPT
jgi:hypothetical protein